MRRPQRFLSIIGALLLWNGVGLAQASCPDFNGDGHVTAADITTLVSFIFADPAPDAATLERADANGDTRLTVADVPAAAALAGACSGGQTPLPSATPTSSSTPGSMTGSASPTPSLTRTVTSTRTMVPTSTPTPTCAAQTVHLGTTVGALTSNDCPQLIGADHRLTDEYSLTGTPGQAIKIDLVATDAAPTILPYLVVVDPSGEFATTASQPPIEFVVTTTQAYQVLVTSAPGTAQQLGAYRLTLTARPCPAPIALTIGATQIANLDGTECPDPGLPSSGTDLNPVDVYTFTVTQVPTNISIVMRQRPASAIDPIFEVVSPDGLTVITGDQVDNSASGGGGFDAGGRFLALQTGTYTILASGNGETGAYSVGVSIPTCTATALSNIPQDRPLTCAGHSGPGCAGTLSVQTPCAAPLALPDSPTGLPDPNSPSNLYTFMAQPGDVISVEMRSDDDAHLYLLGPASSGNPLVAENDDSTDTTTDAQLAATLSLPGVYTIVAANNNPIEDVSVAYTLFVQQCSLRGSLNVASGEPISSTFSFSDCTGTGGVPVSTYVFNGNAGQFVSIGMASGDLNAFLRLFAPNGSVVENDDDLFETSTNARINRLLPVDGVYFVEVSALVGSAVDLSTTPAFTLHGSLCPTHATGPGTISGTFDDGDCTLPTGQKFDVYTVDSSAPQTVASLLPPSNGCIVGLLAEGPQVPENGCSTGPLDLPVLPSARYGFIVANNDPAARGPYSARLNSCPLDVIGYGTQRTGSVTATTCAAATGGPAAWFFVRGPSNVVRFNDGMTGNLAGNFNMASVLEDTLGSEAIAGEFCDVPDTMYPLGSDLGFLIRVSGVTPTDLGSYQLTVDPAAFQ